MVYFLYKLYNAHMFRKVLMVIAVFVVLAMIWFFVAPMTDGFSHNLPDGGCVSLITKNLPCSKNGFQADILMGLFLLLGISLLLLIAKKFILTVFSRTYSRFFEYHSFSHKIKANRWLALFSFA